MGTDHGSIRLTCEDLLSGGGYREGGHVSICAGREPLWD